MGGPVGHTIDLTSEFLLGTKIAHVWKENESFVISICGIQVHERGSYKKALFVGHPVYISPFEHTDTSLKLEVSRWSGPEFGI